MKKLILVILMFGFINAGYSQIVLKEAKIDYDPASMKLDPYTNSLTIHIPETRVGEFREDPLFFIKNKFDMYSLADANKREPYNDYEVWFNTKDGYLLANFDKRGKLISSSQRFKDVLLPQETRDKIISEHGVVQIVGSKYSASSKGYDLNKEVYTVKIKDANNKTHRLRMKVPEKRSTLAGL